MPSSIEAPLPPTTWANAIADRVGRYGLGQWFAPLGQWLELPADLRWLPQSCADGPQVVPAARRAVQLYLTPLPTFATALPRFRRHHVVLDSAWFNARMVRERPDECALPFGLDALADTPERVADRLATPALTPAADENHPPQTCAYVLPEGRWAHVCFEPAPGGIVWVKLSHPGEARPKG